jgi:hypothetical protein
MYPIVRNLAALLVLPASLGAQTLEQRITGVRNGTVHLSFAARSGVCGDGAHNINTRQVNEEWEDDCQDQPVRVSLRVSDHRVIGLRTYVGGRWRVGSTARDLGTVRPQEAAAYFLTLAAREIELDGDPVLPATLADSATIWPSLLRLARSRKLPEERRRTAIFWLGQAAGAVVGQALDSIAADEGGDRELRKTALFWLAQSDDPRAVDLFEEILR